MKGEHGGLEFGYSSPRWTNEIADCSLPVTFDTYSNCSFNCVYCFSQFQRGLGGAKEDYFNKKVRAVDPAKVIALFEGHADTKYYKQFLPFISDRRTLQWGGLSDQFDGFERKYGITLEIMRHLRKIKYPVSFSTKGTWIFDDERYQAVFRGADCWNMKFSIITLDEADARAIEIGVPSPQQRLEAMQKWVEMSGGTATLRLRPFIPGVSTKTYRDLIVAAKDHGATAVSTEFLCLEVRAKRARDNYRIISERAGFDIYEFYRKYSIGTGYLRLNRKVKEQYMLDMKELCDKLGLRFYVSDAHFKELCNNACCCGLPPEWEYSRGSFSYALELAKKNGTVRFSDIEADMKYLEFPWVEASGYNTHSIERRAKYYNMTMKDYLRYLWNNPNEGQGPYKIFERVLVPVGKDDAGDLVYEYRGG